MTSSARNETYEVCNYDLFKRKIKEKHFDEFFFNCQRARV